MIGGHLAAAVAAVQNTPVFTLQRPCGGQLVAWLAAVQAAAERLQVPLRVGHFAAAVAAVQVTPVLTLQ